MAKFSGRGGEVRWQKSVRGIWSLRERLPRGDQTRGTFAIIGKVVPVGREYRALDWVGIDRGIFRSVSPAKKVVEQMANVREKR